MRIDQAFPSSYMRASELNGKSYVLTMGRVEMETVGDDERPVLHFQNAGKGLPLNKTNANMLETLFGPETDNWFGQQIEIYPDITLFQGRRVDCIRVRRPGGIPPLASTLPPASERAPSHPQSTTNPGPGQQSPIGGHVDPTPPANTGLDDEVPF